MTAALLAIEESFIQPEPTVLGLPDYPNRPRVGKERLKAVNAERKFVVPWLGWLIFAIILTVVACVFFGLGSWYRQYRTQAKAGQGAGVPDRMKGTLQEEGTKQLSGQEDPATLQDVISDPSRRRRHRDSSSAFNSNCLPCVGQQCGTLFNRAVKQALSSLLDKQVLGVAVQVGNVRVNARSGSVTIEGLVLQNPEGYHSEYFLRVEKLLLQVSMAKYIFSRGKNVVIGRLAISGVEVNYEKALTTSNVEHVLRHVSKRGEEEGTSQATVTSAVLGALATGTTGAMSVAGGTADVLGVGDRTMGMLSDASTAVRSASRASMVGRIAGDATAAVAGTVTDVLKGGAGVLGTGLAAGTAVVQTVESGALSGVRRATVGGLGLLTDAGRAVGVGSSSAEQESPTAAESPRDKGGVTVKRLDVTNLGVTMASNLVGGCGMRLQCADLCYEDFTAEAKVSAGTDIVKFILQSTLLSALGSLSSLGDFTLGASARAFTLGRSMTKEVLDSATRAVQGI